MLYRVGTEAEISSLSGQIPERVMVEVLQGVIVLDAEYGANRDYLTTGGYSLIADTAEDAGLAIVSIGKNHPCEWVTRIGTSGWVSVLYVINNDFSIMLYAPESTMPIAILQELEDDVK